jgi:hypothetical protein
MTRRFAQTGERAEDLEDFKVYHASLADLEMLEGNPEYGGGKRLKITWRLDSGLTLLDFLSFKIGSMPGGEPAKMRTLLNAIGGRARHEPIEWVDDDTLDFKFPDRDLTYRITDQAEVDLRGRTQVTYSPSGEEIRRFRITEYLPTATAEELPL